MKNKRFLLLLIIPFLIKGILAIFLELNNDEVYYWTYIKHLQLNYFDHPPMIALLLRIFTGNLLFQQEFFLRLGPLVCSMVCVNLIFLIGRKLKDDFTGIIACLLFLASPYADIIAGMLVIPDAPQLMFWLWSVLLVLEIFDPANIKKKNSTLILLLGFTIGCCIMSKVHGIFLWVGFLGYLVLFNKKTLKKQEIFYALLISAIIVLPILIWNIDNNFITYRYHSNRINFFNVHIDDFVRELMGEIFYNNPINVILLITALVAAFKQKKFIPLWSTRVLLLMALPLVITVLVLSFFNETLPHWSGPAYTTLIPFTAAWLRSKQLEGTFGLPIKTTIPNIVKASLIVLIVLVSLAFPAVKWLPVNIGSKEWQQLGKHDVTLDMNGWKNFSVRFDSLYNADIQTGTIRKNTVIISDYWFPAAHLDYYVARPLQIPCIAIGSLSAIHNYAWRNTYNNALQPGDDAYYIIVSNFFNEPSLQIASKFEHIDTPVCITQFRSTVAVRNFFIYRLIHYKGTLPPNGVLQQ